MKNVLFVCSQNKLRSPTAEQVFSNEPGLQVRSAGLEASAVVPLTPELIEWADIVCVMTRAHIQKLRKQYRPYLNRQKVYCLNIPDDFGFMDPELITLLRARAGPLLR